MFSRASRQLMKVFPSRKIVKIQGLCYSDPKRSSVQGLCVSMGMRWCMEVSNCRGVGGYRFVRGLLSNESEPVNQATDATQSNI